jgi:hypothetical protein
MYQQISIRDFLHLMRKPNLLRCQLSFLLHNLLATPKIITNQLLTETDVYQGSYSSDDGNSSESSSVEDVSLKSSRKTTPAFSKTSRSTMP